MPSGCQKLVAIMCWIVRALPSASFTLIRCRGPGPGPGSGPVAALVFERHGRKTVAPCVLLSKGQNPEFGRCGEPGDVAFRARGHVDSVDALAVGGVGVADGEFPGVVLGLRHARGQRFIPRLRLDDGQLVVAIDQQVIGG